ncbi:aquaporin SIP protein [Dioscorea alata]|uniref:Aquaporin SIP protein n=1 Tax=Dioscorea alata TaxID=55571 RepID=A0ACB7VE80_DIOAL|nr:aquaporin SIP protein [Dioscorea alata]
MAPMELQLVLSDLLISFLWVWSGSILRYFAYTFLGLGMHTGIGLLKLILAVLYVSFFSWLGKATNGGAYNPLMVLCHAISGSFAGFLFVIFGRIPAQVIGSTIGVGLTKITFPEAYYGPRLNVDIHQGALMEGFLTLLIVILSLGIKKINPENLVLRTWISSLSKVILHFLGSDLTGGIMNPATAFGWAYVQGDHTTKEHLLVYWLAPVEGALLGVWACSLFVDLKKHKEHHQTGFRFKSE